MTKNFLFDQRCVKTSFLRLVKRIAKFDFKQLFDRLTGVGCEAVFTQSCFESIVRRSFPTDATFLVCSSLYLVLWAFFYCVTISENLHAARKSIVVMVMLFTFSHSLAIFRQKSVYFALSKPIGL